MTEREEFEAWWNAEEGGDAKQYAWLGFQAGRRTTPDREASPKTLNEVWDGALERCHTDPNLISRLEQAAQENAPSSVFSCHPTVNNVISLIDKVPGVFYSVSIEQGPDGVRNVRVHDVAETQRDREAVAFALREAADIIAPKGAPNGEKK